MKALTIRRSVLMALCTGSAWSLGSSPVQAWHGTNDINQIVAACNAGDREACGVVLDTARRNCLNGNQFACQVASQLAGQGGNANRGYPSPAQRNPDLQPYNTNPSPYAQNPLAPHRDMLGDTRD